MIRFAAFDLDGTLLDSLPDLTDGVNYALEREGLARRTEEEVRSFIGSGVFVLLELKRLRKLENGQLQAKF